MKKLFLSLTIMVMVAMLLVPLVGCFSNREEILKVYNCTEYIYEDEKDANISTVKDFEKYYTEVTGKKIKVQYDTYNSNEEMLNKIVGGKADYDVACASDYIIEKLRMANYLIELQKDLGNDTAGNAITDYRNNISPLCSSRPFDPENKYSRTYMWGTMGILYNPAMLTEADRVDKDANGHPDFIQSWDAMWSKSYTNKIYMKDSMRDTFAIGAIKTFKQDILAGKMTVEQALNATSASQVALIEKELINQKSILLGYEVDKDKQEVIDGKAVMALQWGGDAFWAIDEAASLATPRNINYYIPDEGSNIFFDGWFVPKNCKNSLAAQLWINFMCKPEIAIQNMDYIGYSTGVATQEVMDWMNTSYADFSAIDLSYFFGESGKAVKMDARQFPTKAMIDRCAVMRDFGENNKNVTDLWARVKAA
ncbi:MAG: ABC transporter substrate-binding protein [Clostridia bacterium]